MIIGFIKKQQFTKKQPIIVSDSVNYLSAKFVFQTSEWDEMIKFAHFQSGDDVYDFLLDGDELPKEASLNLYAGNWKVYIHGDRYVVGNDGNAKVVERATTNSQELKVVKYEKEGSVLPEISFDVAEQIAAVAEDAKRIATSVRNEADQGMFDGKDGADGEDGITPHIGDNGNWWLGEEDTGKPSRGEDGKDSTAEKPLYCNLKFTDERYGTCDKSFAEMEEAIKAGREVLLRDENKYWIRGFLIEDALSIRASFVSSVQLYKYSVRSDGSVFREISKIPSVYNTTGTSVDDTMSQAAITKELNKKLGSDELPNAVNEALTLAKESGEFDGADGKNGSDGKDGITPHIGENGNWWIGDTDIGVKAGGAESWHELTDKPFYTELVPPYEVLAETTLESQGADGGINVFMYMGSIPAVPGETYTVIWNGKEYPCTCNAVNDEAISLGNLAIMGAGDDTGEPFVMAILDIGAEIYGNDGATTVTLSIIGGGGEKVHKIDEKYLPETVATKAYVEELLGVIENGTY